MKRIIMLKNNECASGDTRNGHVYEVVDDTLCISCEDETIDNIPYTKEDREKYPEARRWITIKDESSEDCFYYYEDEEDRFIFCEDDRDFAHKIIDHVEGFDKTIVNMANLFIGMMK